MLNIGDKVRYKCASWTCLENGCHGFIGKIVDIKDGKYHVRRVNRNGELVGDIHTADVDETSHDLAHKDYVLKY